MGGDGGTTAVQRKFVRGQEKESSDKGDGEGKEAQQMERVATCALSAQPLSAPVVVCELGKLYNKEAVLQALLDKTLQRQASHIRGLKDVKELDLGGVTSPSFYVCPITQLSLNGILPFVVVWTNGRVLSEKGVREMGVEFMQLEYGPFCTEDLVRLLPIEESEIVAQTFAMERRRSLRDKDKKGGSGKVKGTKRKAPEDEHKTTLELSRVRDRTASEAAAQVERQLSESAVYAQLFTR